MGLVTTAEAGEPGPVKPGRFRLTSPVTATVLGVLTVILTAAGIMLSILDHQGSILGSGGIVPIALVYAAVASSWPGASRAIRSAGS